MICGKGKTRLTFSVVLGYNKTTGTVRRRLQITLIGQGASTQKQREPPTVNRWLSLYLFRMLASCSIMPITFSKSETVSYVLMAPPPFTGWGHWSRCKMVYRNNRAPQHRMSGNHLIFSLRQAACLWRKGCLTRRAPVGFLLYQIRRKMSMLPKNYVNV